MTKRIQRHIDAKNFLRVEVKDRDGDGTTVVWGYVFAQSKELLLMCDTNGLYYDGLVVVLKNDIDKIDHGPYARFLREVLRKEGVEASIFKRVRPLLWPLGTQKEAMEHILRSGMAAILDDIFADGGDAIGPFIKVGKKRLTMRHIYGRGKYRKKPLAIKYGKVHLVKFDSPYGNAYLKHAVDVK